MFLEDLREVVGVLEANGRSDLLNRKGRAVQQLLGPIDPQLQVVLVGRQPGLLGDLLRPSQCSAYLFQVTGAA